MKPITVAKTEYGMGVALGAPPGPLPMQMLFMRASLPLEGWFVRNGKAVLLTLAPAPMVSVMLPGGGSQHVVGGGA